MQRIILGVSLCVLLFGSRVSANKVKSLASRSTPFVASNLVEAWHSHPIDANLMMQKIIVSKSANPSGAQDFINLMPEEQNQKIIGYGGALTESAVMTLLRLPADRLDETLRVLFDIDSGAGFNFLRVPMGSSDLADGSRGEYTYDDSPASAADPDLSYFSMARDQKTLDLLIKIKKINPELKIMINPWTAPPWMKSNQAFYGGEFLSENTDSLANYFIKTIETFHQNKLEVDYVGIQNEPGISILYPSMLMSDDQQEVLIQMLGRKLSELGFKAKILAHDDNYSAIDRVLRFAAHPETRKYLAGAAFHCWSDDPEEVERLTPLLPRFETECGANISSDDYAGDFAWWIHNRMIDGSNRLMSTVLGWSLVTDELAGPFGAGPEGCRTCRGLLTITTGDPFLPIKVHPEFFALAHVSKFVRPGARRISSSLTGQSRLNHTAFRNVDGSFVLVIANRDNVPAKFEIKVRNKLLLTYSLLEGEAATLRWY